MRKLATLLTMLSVSAFLVGCGGEGSTTTKPADKKTTDDTKKPEAAGGATNAAGETGKAAEGE